MLNPFIDAVTDRRRGLISPERVSGALHVTVAEVARLAQVHRNTLRRKADSPAVQRRLGEIARIIGAAAELLEGDTGRAIVWFRHQPLSGFDGRTAADLVASGEGAAVVTHLEMLRDGNFA